MMILNTEYRSGRGQLRTTLSLQYPLEGLHRPFIEEHLSLRSDQVELIIVPRHNENHQGGGPLIQEATMRGDIPLSLGDVIEAQDRPSQQQDDERAHQAAALALNVGVLPQKKSRTVEMLVDGAEETQRARVDRHRHRRTGDGFALGPPVDPGGRREALRHITINQRLRIEEEAVENKGGHKDEVPGNAVSVRFQSDWP